MRMPPPTDLDLHLFSASVDVLQSNRTQVADAGNAYVYFRYIQLAKESEPIISY